MKQSHNLIRLFWGNTRLTGILIPYSTGKVEINEYKVIEKHTFQSPQIPIPANTLKQKLNEQIFHDLGALTFLPPTQMKRKKKIQNN